MQRILNYQERSRRYLEKAREELAAGDLEQASEKGWGAAALMVKAVAQQRGERHRKHGFLFTVVEDLVDETGDDELRRLFDSANSLHTNFYEGEFGRRAVTRRLPDIERFVEKMGQILESIQ